MTIFSLLNLNLSPNSGQAEVEPKATSVELDPTTAQYLETNDPTPTDSQPPENQPVQTSPALQPYELFQQRNVAYEILLEEKNGEVSKSLPSLHRSWPSLSKHFLKPGESRLAIEEFHAFLQVASLNTLTSEKHFPAFMQYILQRLEDTLSSGSQQVRLFPSDLKNLTDFYTDRPAARWEAILDHFSVAVRYALAVLYLKRYHLRKVIQRGPNTTVFYLSVDLLPDNRVSP